MLKVILNTDATYTIDEKTFAVYRRALSLLEFAVINEKNFVECDVDGVKQVWMDIAKEIVES